MSKAFTQIAEQENVLLVVDALNLAFRWQHKGATNFAEDYIRTVDSLKRSYKAKWVIIAADKGKSKYRSELYPEYKANRSERFAEQTELEAEAFRQFMEDYNATLNRIRETNKYPVLQFSGVEADDISAYISKSVSLGKLPTVSHVWNISTDRDWDLLTSDKVSRFSYYTRKEITANNWHTHYDCTQEQYLCIKCLMGDPGDNVPGVDSIGPKRAQTLIDSYGSAFDVAMALPINSNLKYIKALNDFGSEQILTNYKLMDLISYCEEALGDNVQIIDAVLQEVLV